MMEVAMPERAVGADVLALRERPRRVVFYGRVSTEHE